jgi:endonuclease/exonuclease/phosphatase family metal-dependent hydrolase
MKRLLRITLLPVVLALLVGLLCIYPAPDATASAIRRAWDEFKLERLTDGGGTSATSDDATPASSLLLSIMSFNLRLDGEEHNPEHHWTKRLYRVRDVLEEYQPASVGLQEPFAGQVLHLQSVLDKKWIGVGNQHDSPHNLGHPSRQRDMQTGILYDSEKLELKNWHYHWLSKTPDVPGSKDWNSSSPRTLMVARFLRRSPSSSSSLEEDGLEILHFNTHLDVKSEEARRNQASLVRKHIEHYSQVYPKAVIFLTGDFNTAVGQKAYEILTDPEPLEKKKDERSIADTWTTCEATHPAASCHAVSSSPAMSFHGWQGLRLNSFMARLVARGAFVLYGMGFTLPISIPMTARDVARALYGIVQTGWKYSLVEALPSSFARMHVDWILYGKEAPGETSREGEDGATVSERPYVVTPKFISLVDVRSAELHSSDHYPLLAIFEVTKTTGSGGTGSGAPSEQRRMLIRWR